MDNAVSIQAQCGESFESFKADCRLFATTAAGLWEPLRVRLHTALTKCARQTAEDQVAAAVQPMRGAEVRAECAMCRGGLCGAPCVVFQKPRPFARYRPTGRASWRSCDHFVHEGCAAPLANRLCPLCLTPWTQYERIPSIETSPREWFKTVDVGGDSKLSRAQVAGALTTCFPLDLAQFDRKVDEMWPVWDHDGSGYISKREFFAPNGLLEYVRAHLLRDVSVPARSPSLERDPAIWFDHWCSPEAAGRLTCQQMVRAVAKTHGLTSAESVERCRARLGAVWAFFADVRVSAASGETVATTAISREAFLRPGGLADGLAGRLSFAAFVVGQEPA